MNRRTLIASGLAALAPFSQARAADAQAYPDHPVKIVVGFSAGSGTDILARIIAEEFRTAFNQPFVVEKQARRQRPDRGGVRGPRGAGRLHAAADL